MVLNIFYLCLGIVLLYFGSEWTVKGSTSLALSFSIRPAIVGLTVVAFATSSPELLVSLIAAYKGSCGISLGNILGSNVANIGLVLGASATIMSLTVEKKLIHQEIPFMIGASGLFWLVCLDGRLGRIDGIILLAGLGLFLVIGIMTARKSPEKRNPGFEQKKTVRFIFLILIGMAGLLMGADLTVRAAIFIARHFGLSEIFIGLSIVAVGTSLPELATSVVAGVKGQHDISVANVIGSNVFNICLVIGTVGLFNPMPVDMGLMRFEFPAMFILSVIVYIFSRTNFTLSRIEGIIFVLSYISFVGISYWIGKGN